MVHRRWTRRQGRVKNGGCRGLVCGVGGVHQYDAGDIRDDSGFIEQGQGKRGLGCEGHHVVCVLRARAHHTIEG